MAYKKIIRPPHDDEWKRQASELLSILFDDVGTYTDGLTTYVKLSGRSGGQTVSGDTASGGDLVIQSTSHATKGLIYLGDHANGNETVIEADGTIRFDGTATTFRDELNDLVGKNLQSPSSHVTADYAEAAITYDDACTLDDFVFMNIQLNHDWKVDSVIYPHLHWWQASSTLPFWLIAYRWQTNGSAKDTSWSYLTRSADVFTYTSGTINQITKFGSITPSGAGISDILQIKLFRDTAGDSGEFGILLDPLSGDVSATSLDIHMEKDTLGSRSEYSK